MTTGQRISEKRKELGLSQEALGEKLGVSRQSIYKWESDTSLPDVDKLIALSRLFGVSVGWLLGVEEDAPPPSPSTDAEDWSARQEQIIEDVLKRYQQTLPKSKKTGQKWTVRFLGFACVVLLVSIFTLNSQLDDLNRKYNSLNASIEEVKNNTYYELDDMSDRMTQRIENVLKAQGDLAVDYDCEVKSFDLLQETITFSLSVVPKTYSDGMSIYFQANSGGAIVESLAQQVTSQTFTGELTCPLTDEISISVIFQTGNTRQIQLLNEYMDLNEDVSPDYFVRDTALNNRGGYQPDGSYQFPEQYVYFAASDDLTAFKTSFGIVRVTEVKVGLFLDHQLLHWLEPSKRPSHFEGRSDSGMEDWDKFFHDGYTYFHSPQLNVLTVEDGSVLHFAARVTDEFGRVIMVPAENRYVMRNGKLLPLDKSSDLAYTDPTAYKF